MLTSSSASTKPRCPACGGPMRRCRTGDPGCLHCRDLACDGMRAPGTRRTVPIDPVEATLAAARAGRPVALRGVERAKLQATRIASMARAVLPQIPDEDLPRVAAEYTLLCGDPWRLDRPIVGVMAGTTIPDVRGKQPMRGELRRGGLAARARWGILFVDVGAAPRATIEWLGEWLAEAARIGAEGRPHVIAFLPVPDDPCPGDVRAMIDRSHAQRLEMLGIVDVIDLPR